MHFLLLEASAVETWSAGGGGPPPGGGKPGGNAVDIAMLQLPRFLTDFDEEKTALNRQYISKSIGDVDLMLTMLYRGRG